MHQIYFTTALLIFCLQPLFAQWTTTEMAPMPMRVSNNAVCEGFIGDTPYIFSFAGIDSTKSYSGLHLHSFRFNTLLNEWEAIPPLPDTRGKIAAAASRVGNIIYITGGYHVFSNGSEQSSDKVHRYDILNNQYLEDGTPIPVPVDDHVQDVWRDSLIYLITGWSDSGNIPDVQIYNPHSNTWMAGTPTPNTSSYKSFGASGIIIEDTIYYFGGARATFNFPIQNEFRKGVINPQNPTEIEWSFQIIDPSIRGYRMAATKVGNTACWLGGSGVTYNFDGIAYNGTGGVSPLNRSFCIDTETGNRMLDFENTLPMDLRGAGSVNDTVKYLAGGMYDNQMVGNKTLRLQWTGSSTTSSSFPEKPFHLQVYPNPASSLLYVDIMLPYGKNARFSLINVRGEIVRTQTLTNEESTSKIWVTGLPPGMYFYQVFTTEGESRGGKIILR